jgi:hypothetical protein
MRLASTLLLATFLTACAHDVSATYPSRGAPATGRVVVLLTGPAPDLTVAVNGAVVASRKHSQKVTVAGVPAGANDVDVAFRGGAYARAEHHITVDVLPGEDSTLVLPGPEESTAYAIEHAAVVLGEFMCLAVVYAAIL